MYPSSRRIWAMSLLMRDAGMSTRVCFAVTALRIRVSMSAIGSVISLSNLLVRVRFLPAALGHARDVAVERKLPEAQAAQRKLPHVGARPATQVAAVPQANLEFRLLLFFRDLRSRCHLWSLNPGCDSWCYCRNGTPMNCSSLRASSSV